MALVSDDVNWPDDDAGRLHGKDEVRAYWTEQWARARTLDEPVVSQRPEMHIDPAGG